MGLVRRPTDGQRKYEGRISSTPAAAASPAITTFATNTAATSTAGEQR